MRRLLSLFFAVGTIACGGSAEETLLDQFKGVAVVAEPPEVAAGELSEVTLFSVDPDQGTNDLMTWTCTQLQPGQCLEEASGINWWRLGTTTGSATTTVQAAPFLSEIVAEQGSLVITGYSLVCAPGVCPIIDEAGSVRPGTDAWYDFVERIASPAFLGDLPIEGVSLVTWPLTVSDLPVAERNRNPTLSPRFDGTAEVEIEGETTLGFDAVDPDDEPVRLWGYTTNGGFELGPFYAEEVDGELTWFGGEEAGDALLVVVADDDRGGTALWSGPGSVVE